MIPALAWPVAIAAALPSAILSCELFAGLLRDTTEPPASPSPAAPLPPITVLVPAHDEAAGIARTVVRIRQQLRATDRLIVIADNCSDDTAALAGHAGAEVIERNDVTLRGKAYALAKAREAVRATPPAIVLLIDADCIPAPDAIPRLAASVQAQDAVVQAKYLLECDADASILVRISTFAFLIKNFVRQNGLQRLSGSALLQGSGMGFPWRIFEQAPLESASLVEDLELGLTLALKGHPVRFEPRACFTSSASSRSATASQRTRWEHGMIGGAARFCPRLIAAGLSGRPRLLPLAANLIVPPLALFVALQCAVAALLLLAGWFGGGVGPAILQLTAFALAMLALAASWAAFGQRMLPIRALPGIAAYILWKLPIYGRYVANRQREWVRTDRAP